MSMTLERIWIVKRLDNGESHTLYKEPLEGIERWAAGQKVIIVEFVRKGVVYPAPKLESKGVA